MQHLQSLKKITIDTLYILLIFSGLIKSDLQYQGEFWTALGKSFPMMVLDVKIDKVITKKIAGKVFFSNFSRFLLQVPLDLYILLIFSNMAGSNCMKLSPLFFL